LKKKFVPLGEKNRIGPTKEKNSTKWENRTEGPCILGGIKQKRSISTVKPGMGTPGMEAPQLTQRKNGLFLKRGKNRGNNRDRMKAGVLSEEKRPQHIQNSFKEGGEKDSALNEGARRRGDCLRRGKKKLREAKLETRQPSSGPCYKTGGSEFQVTT